MPDKGEWEVLLSKEVEKWFRGLGKIDRIKALRAIRQLETQGPILDMPHGRSLGDGLREIRFMCEDVPRRITYYFDPPKRIITLTTFRKQRQKDQPEVARAKKAMRKNTHETR
jgi:hypothetical protein